MTKSELKPGYVVRNKNGDYRMVMELKDGLVLVQMQTTPPIWGDFSLYNENLENEYHDGLTIVEVYGLSKSITTVWKFKKEDRELLWKRNEKKKYTYAQLREILGEEFEVVG